MPLAIYHFIYNFIMILSGRKPGVRLVSARAFTSIGCLMISHDVPINHIPHAMIFPFAASSFLLASYSAILPPLSAFSLTLGSADFACQVPDGVMSESWRLGVCPVRRSAMQR